VTERVFPRVLAPALLLAGALMAAAVAMLRPEHAVPVIVAAGALAAMAVVLWRVERGAPVPTGRRSVRDGVALASSIIVLSLAVQLAGVLGVHPPGSLMLRVAMLATAVFLVMSGNALPKVLVPASRFDDVARVDACRRVAGRTIVLTGVALGVVWLVLPEDPAMVTSLVLFGIALLVLIRPPGPKRGRGEVA